MVARVHNISKMWIVRLALRRPYTFVVMAIVVAVKGERSIVTTPTDIFPYTNIPMVGLIWTYRGVGPDDMARRVLFISTRAMTTTINNRAHAFGVAGYFLGRS